MGNIVIPSFSKNSLNSLPSSALDSGSALITVLAVLFILLTAFFAVFSLALNRASFLHDEMNRIRASYLAEAGLNRFLHVSNSRQVNWKSAAATSLVHHPPGGGRYDVRAALYGGYLAVSSRGTYKGRTVCRKALVGVLPWSDLNAAVVNCSMDYSLVLAGRSRITGDAIVGPEPIRPGSISGEEFSGRKLVDGNICHRPNAPFPEINREIIREYIKMTKSARSDSAQRIYGSAIWQGQIDIAPPHPDLIIIGNDLEIYAAELRSPDRPITIIAGGNIRIDGESRIDGLVQFVAERSIVVANGSRINDAVLLADDSLIIGGAAQFTGQAICGGRIGINDRAEIRYPSLLYAYYPGHKGGSMISFGRNTTSAVVAIAEGNTDPDSPPVDIIQIDSGAVVKGTVICPEGTDIKGQLHGTSLTGYYYYYDEPTLYINWLKDAEINRSRLDFLTVLPMSFAGRNDYAILMMIDDD